MRRAELITDLPDGASGIFLREGMDRLSSDLPVALLCRSVDTCSQKTHSVIFHAQLRIGEKTEGANKQDLSKYG